MATRDIKPGETVLKEAVLIWGPSQITIPVCVGCGKGLKEGDCKPCEKCGWPACSEKCEQSQSHKPECYYTANAGKKVSGRKNVRCLGNCDRFVDVYKKFWFGPP